MKLELFNYWRSSASQRVRIGLNLKGLAYGYSVINIVKQEQDAAAYREKNPIGHVPALVVTEDDGRTYTLTQSLPILEFLDERFPDTAPLLSRDPVLRAKTRALAEMVNSGIQPLQNLSVTRRLEQLNVAAKDFVPGFIANGLVAYARAARDTAGTFSVGDTPSLADCCLIPQLGAARRFGCLVEGQLAHGDLPTDAIDLLLAIEARCLALPAFTNAAPDRQPDAVK